ncbi:MAG: radical SAM protein [Myxococcales bacterium]|nr:radical SAM protein [Myxococcales bacterium]
MTTRCAMRCGFCHMEGDPGGLRPARLPTETWVTLLSVGLEVGVRKLKFLGGEPLLRSDLPIIVRAIRDRDPQLDISVITSGTVPTTRLDQLFDAGLSRANMSVHGFTERAFAHRGQRPGLFPARQRFLDAVIERARAGTATKLNYVYTGRRDDHDLSALLDWAASRPVVVNVLDDLGNPALSPESLLGVLAELRRKPAQIRVEPDPHSLPTTHLHYDDGLVVELKTERLGRHAPWLTCDACSAREGCREGIHALRLGHDGSLRPCMDRTDLGVNLVAALNAGGPAQVRSAWSSFVRRTAR